MYALIKRIQTYYKGPFSILDTQYISFSRSPLLSAFSATVQIFLIDPCHAVDQLKIMGDPPDQWADLVQAAQADDGHLNSLTCKYACCPEGAKQQAAGGFSLVVGRGLLGIDNCSASLQHGGFFLVENATVAAFDSLSRLAMQRMEADDHCEFRSVVATVRMVMVEKCMGMGMGTSSPHEFQIGRVDELRSVLRDNNIELIPTKRPFCFDPFLYGLTMLVGVKFDLDPLRVLLLQASVADVCVLAALFGGALVVAVPTEGYDESNRKCSSGSDLLSSRIEVRQPAADERFDVVVDMVMLRNSFDIADMAVTSDSFGSALVEALSRVKEGGWFITTSSCRGPDENFPRFVDFARRLAGDVLPQELSDVLSIHLYNGSVFIRKVQSQRFR
jgi:hypothetical protein